MVALAGKVAVVTGAASGIGEGLARRFAAEGMRLVLADVDDARLAALASELQETGAAVVTLRTDVSSSSQVEALAAAAYCAFGAVHVLCNNAGVVPGARFRQVWEYEVEDWLWGLGVNLMGIVHSIRSFVPRMRAGGDWGHIVNTTSVSGFISGATAPVYGATKHAAQRVTEALHASLRAENSPIWVTALIPGAVDTRISESEAHRPAGLVPEGGAVVDGTERQAQMARLKPQGLKPAEVAEMVVGALRSRQFYLFTTGAFDAAIRDRAEAVLGRSNPEFADHTTLVEGEVRGRS
jgi:NAD(P)-dependent dehydrogenase (short-subunit alcohol dehydrogenase family)